MATRFVNLEQLLETSAHSTQHAGGHMSWNYAVPRGRTAFQSIFDGLSAAHNAEADSIADEKKSDSNFDAGMKDDLNGNPLNNGNPLLKRSKPDAPRAHSAHPGEDVAVVDQNSEQMDSEEMASYLGAGQPVRADQRLVGVNSGPDEGLFSVSTNGRGSPVGGLNGVDNGSIGNRLQENRDLLSVPPSASASSSKTKSEPEASTNMMEGQEGGQDAGEAETNSAGKSKSSRSGEQSADAGGSADQQNGQKRQKDDDDDDDSGNQQGPFDEDEQGESNKASGGPRGGDHEDGRGKAGASAKSDGSQGDDDDADPGSGGAAAATGRGNKDHPRPGRTRDHPGSRSGKEEGQMWSKLFGSDAGGHERAPKGEEGPAGDGSDATEVFAAPNADDTQHEVFVQDGQQKRPHQQGAQEKPNGPAEDHEDVTVVTDSARPEDPPLAVIVTEDENENGVPPAALLPATGKRTNAPAGMGENWFAPPVPRAVARDQEELPPIASWSSPGSLIGTALCLGAQAYLGAYIFARYLRKPEEEDGGAEEGRDAEAEDQDQVPEDEHEADDPAQDYVTVSMRDVVPPSVENQVTAASPGAGGRTGSGSASAGGVEDGDIKKKGGHSLSGTFASKSPVGTSSTGGKEGQQGTVRLYTPRAVVEGGDTTEPEEVVVAQDDQEAETLGKTGLTTHQQHLPDPDGERAQPGAELASDNQLAVSGGLVVLHTSSETEALGTSIETIEKAEEQFSAKKDDAAASERASLAPPTTNVEDALTAEGAATQVSLVAAQTQRETKSAAVASETESTTSGATGSSYVDVGSRSIEPRQKTQEQK